MKLVRLVSLAIGSLLLVSTFAFAQEGGSEAMDEAKRQYRNGNYQAAIDELTHVTDEAPDRADAFLLAGLLSLDAPPVPGLDRSVRSRLSARPRARPPYHLSATFVDGVDGPLS